ncbi:hypothetical protein [Mycolicibacterium brumae]|uniref:Uncharacterized protein n=1 Tax=Mycolicibacterium brumae TaxID=85968 RepID=A0A2G5PCG8_9MYCO|nr:hypothetical protein [Mycolicibacterium brumae]MCV7193319.1 hypothetical protein [Mycolicibacterium brumae]PIB75594.1 hypothetical protein CQY22_009265 [Mycolicibacterium brumae]RWA21036.1 hypothetical protein MBRU_15120 [Mycolicibacterium brumae DSM 44177]UWW09976.1 hypothetical protein L2Z93_003094 [Mycolicibacterium brumae]
MRIRWENRHTERLRQARIGWDLAEVGAPCFSPDWVTEPDDIHLLRIAAVYGDCPPGNYRYRRPPRDFEYSFYVDELPDDGDFAFTAEHRTLLAAMSWELSDPYAGDDIPGADPKRPYGDFTFYQLEMALALELIPAQKPADHDPMTPEIVEAMTALHFQSQPALQVFLQNFEIPAGRVFDGEDWGGWAPHDS